jgi:hypothetical protein
MNEKPWPMQLTIDAHDLDTIRVRPRRFGTGPQIHLSVRTGPLLVYCLDGAAVASIAAAWAQAQASSADLLPTRPAAPRPAAVSRRAKTLPGGDAWAAADVVAEGHQRWDVTAPRPGQPFTIVTTNWLTVRVHDRAALGVHTEAWAGACAIGQQLMHHPPPTFDRLLRDAFDREFAHHHRDDPSSGRGRTR